MIKMIIGGAIGVALLAGPAIAADPRSPTPSWIVTPSESGCRIELDLTSRSGAVTPVTLTSDGQIVSLRFSKDDLPARAFLPIRVDRVRYSNLMLRGDDGSGELVLSEETEGAMRRGGALDIAWLADEPLSASLAGSDQGLADLRVCGAQAASRYRERTTAQAAQAERAEADARARELASAQLAAVKAQEAAAEAQRREVVAAAERQRRIEAQAQDRAYQEERRRAYEAARNQGRRDDPRPYDAEDEGWAPAQPEWASPYPRRYQP